MSCPTNNSYKIIKLESNSQFQETVSEKGYKETVQVAESTILVVSKAQSRIYNESLLDKAYCIYWNLFFCGKGGAIAPTAPPVPTAMQSERTYYHLFGLK